MYILLFVFGCIVGSFLNVLAFRIPEGEGFVGGRSRCRSCGKTLRWRELVPIFSYIMLRGRCAGCKGRISLQYPLVEGATGALFALAYWFSFEKHAAAMPEGAFGFIAFAYTLFIFCVLIVVFITDLREFLIPDRVVIPAIGVSLVMLLANWLLLHCRMPFVACHAPALIGAFAGTAFFLAIVLVSGGQWMGLGDVKLALVMGLFLGLGKFLVALFLAFLAGSLVGAALIALRKKTLASEVPFGAFLAPAALVAFFCGEALLKAVQLYPFRW